MSPVLNEHEWQREVRIMELEAELRSQREANATMLDALERIHELSGDDTSGYHRGLWSTEELTRIVTNAVHLLRMDYDEACGEINGLMAP